MTTITLDHRSMTISEPSLYVDDDQEWLKYVTVTYMQTGLLVTVGSEKPGSYNITNSISTEAAKILARWILDNT